MCISCVGLWRVYIYIVLVFVGFNILSLLLVNFDLDKSYWKKRFCLQLRIALHRSFVLVFGKTSGLLKRTLSYKCRSWSPNVRHLRKANGKLVCNVCYESRAKVGKQLRAILSCYWYICRQAVSYFCKCTSGVFSKWMESFEFPSGEHFVSRYW